MTENAYEYESCQNNRMDFIKGKAFIRNYPIPTFTRQSERKASKKQIYKVIYPSCLQLSPYSRR